ncbi:hypothetical protein FQA39_LY12767 [Lamprigera yunnana]|nr:hypothetical protein FQA39_LY12767 [Lamprigera yunnana]
MFPNQAVIKTQMESILTWIQPWLSLASSHMVEYFPQSLFKTSLPSDLREEIESVTYKDALDFLLGNHIISYPKLSAYVEETKNFQLSSLRSVCWSKDDLNTKLNEWGCENLSGLKLEVFVTPKKSHEIEILTTIVAAISAIKKTTHLIDVGGDASIINTNGAVKRMQLLQRAWGGLKDNPKKSIPPNVETHNSHGGQLYKQVTKFVTEDTNFEELIHNIFLEKSSSFGLIGLHTCGDLGPACVKIFDKNKTIKTLCNVSCCYHLLSEKFEDVNCGDANFGFPLSNFLQNRKFRLGRIARMLSAQSVDRILYKKETPNRAVFYRSILEVLFDKHNVAKDCRKVGRIKKKFRSFSEYANFGLKNSNADVDVSSDELDELFNLYKGYEAQLHVFYLLRCMLAPVIESLILLDQLLFLHENGHKNAFLVHLFDPIISPRCYGLIAFKEM